MNTAVSDISHRARLFSRVEWGCMSLSIKIRARFTIAAPACVRLICCCCCVCALHLLLLCACVVAELCPSRATQSPAQPAGKKRRARARLENSRQLYSFWHLKGLFLLLLIKVLLNDAQSCVHRRGYVVVTNRCHSSGASYKYTIGVWGKEAPGRVIHYFQQFGQYL